MEIQRKLKILALGDFGQTGLGIALREPLKRLYLTGKYDVIQMGIGYNGWSAFLDKNIYPYPVIPVYGRKFGYDCLHKAVMKYQPDIIFTCLDVQWVGFLAWPESKNSKLNKDAINVLCHKNRKFRHLGYFPVDGLCRNSRLPRGFEEIIRGIDIPVTYSEFTCSAIKKQMGIELPMIHHGIDTKTYFPVDRKKARARLNIPTDRFVVGMVATNQERKQFEDFIPAFAKFCKDKPDVSILLFTNPKPNASTEAHDLIDLMDQYEILNRYIDTQKIQMCSDEIMNMVYNAIDIGVLCTQGEGFGLPIIHHHAAGAPVLATDCTSCTELTVHEIERVKPRGTIIGFNNNIVRYLTDIDDLADKLNTLYHERELLAQIGEMGLKNVLQNFDYDNAILPRWEKLLESHFPNILKADHRDSKQNLEMQMAAN